MNFLREKREEKTSGLNVSHKKLGRPKQRERSVTLGLRATALGKNGAIGKPKLVRAPLGDGNYISVKMAPDATYIDLLTAATETFFPKGENEAIGHVRDFCVEIVNCNNKNVKYCLTTKSEFTLSEYISEKMIHGAPKFYLLCTCGDSSDSCGESSELELPEMIRQRKHPPSTVSRISEPEGSATEDHVPECDHLELECDHLEPLPVVDTVSIDSFVDVLLPVVDDTFYLNLTPSGEVQGKYQCEGAENPRFVYYNN